MDSNSPTSTQVFNTQNSQPSSLVPPELRPGKFFGSLSIPPKLAASPLPTADSCPICRNFATDVYQINLVKVRDRASVGCLGCKLINAAFKRYMHEVQDAGKLTARLRYSLRSKTPESIFYASIRIQGPTIHIASTGSDEDSDDYESDDDTDRRYEVFTTAEVDERSRDGIRRGRIILSNPSSTEAFSLISIWMQDCCNDHQDCAQKETRVPTRVLDIGSKTIKLLSSTGKAGRYCALSHCWGSASHSPPRTTKANLESNQSKIEESSLSKTFRDAIVLARHFSIQYIWIDSLCIIQDDKEDWAKESSNMASIYENAYFVIAATQAEHGGIGCFSPRPPPSVSLCLNVAQANGEFAPIYIREKNDHRPFNPLAAYKARADQRYPLLSRAWCLQERLLATRLIHFSREELFWECRTTTLCECRSLISHEESSYENQIGFKRRWAMNRGLRELFDLWHKTLQLYSSLDITYESDRLPALLGLANQLQERGCGEYIHGLWKENLFADLIWRTSTRGTRPKEWKAPSWSWACGDGFSLKFPMQESNSPESLLDVDQPSKTAEGAILRSTLESLDYGQHGLVLTISAPAISVSLCQHQAMWTLRKAKSELSFSAFDCVDDFDSKELPLLCAWIGTIHEDDYRAMRPQILLLQASRGLGGKEAAIGCYERVGLLSLTGYRFDEKERLMILDWFNSAELQRFRIV